MTGKNDSSKKSIYLYYTIIFAMMSLVVFRLFILQDKTFIHNRDGWAQHLKALAYYSGYLRTFFSNLFTGQGFKLPMWDFSIGEGSDVLISLHYYCIGDPISFFSVFFPEEKIYLFYDLSVLLRLYLSGICFIRFCRYMHKENVLAILSGAIVYVFCYWNLLNATKHIFFLNPMLYLPLVLLGVERVIRNDRAWLCSVYVMLSAMTSFYFFYMIVILTVIYVAVRLVFLYHKEVRMIVTTVMRIFVYSLLGFLMSAVISFPIINAMLSNNRLDADYGLHLLYSAFYYDRLPTIFLTTDNTVWLCMGFASPVILSTLMTLKEAKTEPELFCLHVIAILMICFPIFGKIMNGMTYVSNRWSFALALLVAYTLVCKWDKFENNKRFLMISVPVFLGLSFFSAWQREAKIIPGIICVLFLLAILLPNEKGKGLLKQGLLLILILCSIAYMADISYSANGRNRIDSMVNTSEAGNIIGLTEAYQFKELMEETGEDGFFRYSGSDLTANAAILAGTHSTDYYFSIANPDVFAYRSDLGGQ